MKKTSEFKIRYIEDEYGRVSVLPSDAFIDRNIKYQEHVLGKIEGVASLSSRAYESIALAHDQNLVKEEVFQMRPYTYGEKLEASRKASRVIGGEMTTDTGKMNLELLSVVTGKPVGDLEDLPTPIAQAIFDEMSFLSEPDPDRLLFLLTKPTSGDSPVARRVKPSKPS